MSDKSQVSCQIWKCSDAIVLKEQRKYLKKHGKNISKSAMIHKLVTEGAKKK